MTRLTLYKSLGSDVIEKFSNAYMRTYTYDINLSQYACFSIFKNLKGKHVCSQKAGITLSLFIFPTFPIPTTTITTEKLAKLQEKRFFLTRQFFSPCSLFLSDKFTEEGRKRRNAQKIDGKEKVRFLPSALTF